MTKIFTTKKLEKIIHKRIENSEYVVENKLGNWNATVFYVAKKKCLLFVNEKTFFSVIIPRFSTKDNNRIEDMFIECFYNQLIFEKINIDFEKICSNIGEITFNSTNNNRKIIGILNYNIEKLNYFKYNYPIFNSSVIRDMTKKLNETPFKQLGWRLPNEKMESLLS